MSNDLLKCKYTATHGSGAANYDTSSPCTWLDWYNYSTADHTQHRRKCSCGSDATGWGYSYENHTYGEWTYVNGTNHKRTCSVCNHEQTANHGTGAADPGTTRKGTYGEWVYNNESTHKRTRACGYEHTAAHGPTSAGLGTQNATKWLDWYNYSNSDHTQHRRKVLLRK